MNTQIKLTYQGVEYTLEYNRAAVKALEANGFNGGEIFDKPMTNIELMFQCAFIKNHPNTQMSVITDILKECPNKNELLAQLKLMIDETYESLLAEPENGDSGNVSWKTVDLSPKKSEDSSQK
jgi:hypothetical protein